MNLEFDLSQVEKDKSTANQKSSSQPGMISQEHAEEIVNQVMKKSERKNHD